MKNIITFHTCYALTIKVLKMFKLIIRYKIDYLDNFANNKKQRKYHFALLFYRKLY
ncbi:hypothetical protein SCO02_12920 [Staphylococcus ureilyticus]|uniref:Uncharacterized protein n=1 Tax=Staphylococcus ureilyticus TaxID=94138 RepID=A0AB34AHT8_STAUR|nr:hypothetical protein [Staphylococcus ureilyticus]GEQ02851.1 hypothetical protein SCO02_12920 [Staphylococcus ureilyticus]